MPEKENLKSDDSSLALAEVVRILNREKERKDSLESKASSLLNSVTIVITILVSAMGFILSTSAIKNSTFFSFYIIGIALLTFTMIQLIWVLRTKSYVDPFQTENIDEVRLKLEYNHSILTKMIIKEYSKSFVIAFTNNNNKVKTLKFAEFSLILGTVLVIISIIILLSLSALNLI
jgi:hypothetical protein